MSISEKLDKAIKKEETGNAADCLGYRTKTDLYGTYMPNDEWLKFKSGMSPDALEQYSAGGGSELDEKTNKNGKVYPPKMASYGSSSRMIYTLASGITNFVFEKKLSTIVGGQANLDGYYNCDGRHVFVEAKCHEPYSAKSGNISTAYKSVYEYINDHSGEELHCAMTENDDGKTMKVVFSANKKVIERFDIKQMICHLLGIAAGVKNGHFGGKTEFIYLLYNPSALELSPSDRKKISDIYKKTCDECSMIDFRNLFELLLGFFNVDTEKTAVDFNFCLCDQENFCKLVKKGIN